MDSWNDRLSETERADLEEHLANCAGCRDESEDLGGLWLGLGTLETEIEVPSERLRSRFYSFLAEEERRGGRRKRWTERLALLWPRQLLPQMVLVAATLVFGVLVGLAASGLRTGAELDALRAEITSVSESVGLSLLTHPAASERLRGVGLTGRSAGDERIVSALLELVENDPNVNVRLAAIEALATRIEQPGVGPRLARTLPSQKSPMLQMTLLDVLLPTDGERLLEHAAPLLDDENLDETVRERLLEVRGETA